MLYNDNVNIKVQTMPMINDTITVNYKYNVKQHRGIKDRELIMIVSMIQ